MLANLIIELYDARDSEKAKLLQRFFKTGEGEYGEGDKFLGISVPKQHVIAKKYVGLNFTQLEKLLFSPVHEHRLTALLILVDKFKKANEQERGNIFNFYLKHTAHVNNWDLVDLSAHKIVGAFLEDKKRDVLYSLAHSKNLWENRIAIISCFWFIKEEDFNDALRISEILLSHKHDLIHKAVGWALREIGKKNQETQEAFLKKHYNAMPRTMLRYAIEKFDEKKRQRYLKGKTL